MSMDLFMLIIFILIILFYLYITKKSQKEISLYKHKLNHLNKELYEQEKSFKQKEQDLLKQINVLKNEKSALTDKMTASIEKLDFFETGTVLTYNEDYKYLFDSITFPNPIKNAIQKYTGSYGMKTLYRGDIMYVHTEYKGQINKLSNIGEKSLQEYNKLVKENEITYMNNDVFRNYFKLKSEYEEQKNKH